VLGGIAQSGFFETRLADVLPALPWARVCRILSPEQVCVPRNERGLYLAYLKLA
jgi:hypothetical protein